MKEFSSKLLDIMIGVILGLGFQWWPDLKEPWQFIAFVIVYLLIIDYWIDTASALKKFPPKRELDIIIDVALMFSFFLFIYSTKNTITYFLFAFILFRALDIIWIFRAKSEYKILNHDALVMNTWLLSDAVDVAMASALLAVDYYQKPLELVLLGVFIAFWLVIRILSSFRYKRVFFA